MAKEAASFSPSLHRGDSSTSYCKGGGKGAKTPREKNVPIVKVHNPYTVIKKESTLQNKTLPYSEAGLGVWGFLFFGGGVFLFVLGGGQVHKSGTLGYKDLHRKKKVLFLGIFFFSAINIYYCDSCMQPSLSSLCLSSVGGEGDKKQNTRIPEILNCLPRSDHGRKQHLGPA